MPQHFFFSFCWGGFCFGGPGDSKHVRLRREGKGSEGKRREEKRRVMEGRGGTYQEDSGLPRVAVPVANVRRNLLLSESDRRRFSPYVLTLMWIVFSRVASRPTERPAGRPAGRPTDRPTGPDRPTPTHLPQPRPTNKKRKHASQFVAKMSLIFRLRSCCRARGSDKKQSDFNDIG